MKVEARFPAKERTKEAASKTTGAKGKPVKADCRDHAINDRMMGYRDKARQNGVGEETQKTLDRLAREKPKLLKQVKAGELSANAAAIKAGFRTKTITVPIDPEKAARAILKHFTDDELAQIASLITGGPVDMDI